MPAFRRLVAALLLVIALPGPRPAAAEEPYSETEHARFRPTSLDWALWGAGLGSFVAAKLIDVNVREVPPQGLDPAEISLSWDRDVLGNPEPQALTPSDVLEASSLLFPPVVAGITAGDDGFWNAQIRSGWIQSEALLVSVGVSQIVKRATARPRPFAYLDESIRPDDPAYDVTSERAFSSFPSGHATVAWCSSMTGLTQLVLERPDLPFISHFTGGFAAGALAASVSVLRVEGEVHHPTDVLAGAALGAAAGITIPLLHDRGSDLSRGPAWRAALLGLAAGTAAALLVAPNL